MIFSQQTEVGQLFYAIKVFQCLGFCKYPLITLWSFKLWHASANNMQHITGLIWNIPKHKVCGIVPQYYTTALLIYQWPIFKSITYAHNTLSVCISVCLRCSLKGVWQHRQFCIPKEKSPKKHHPSSALFYLSAAQISTSFQNLRRLLHEEAHQTKGHSAAELHDIPRTTEQRTVLEPPKLESLTTEKVNSNE